MSKLTLRHLRLLLLFQAVVENLDHLLSTTQLPRIQKEPISEQPWLPPWLPGMAKPMFHHVVGACRSENDTEHMDAHGREFTSPKLTHVLRFVLINSPMVHCNGT